MHDAPSREEIIAAVTSFLTDVAAPQLTGHAAFHARVAANLLATLDRENNLRPAAEQAEAARLQTLLPTHHGKSVADMNAALCDLIRSGAVNAATPGLMQHLKSTTIDQLNIDQPKYSGLKAAQHAQS